MIFLFERLIHSKTRRSLASLERPLLTLRYKDLEGQTIDYGEFRLAQIEAFKGGDKMDLLDPLKQYFGFTSFRQGQEEIISTLLNQKDVLRSCQLVMAKVYVNQLTGYLQDGMVLIVSPLLSLMEDQVGQLQNEEREKGIGCL